MQYQRIWPHAPAALALAACLALGQPQAAHAAIAEPVSDNTAQAGSGESVSIDLSNWVAASFTSATAYSQVSISATLLASNTGSATLSLFSSDASGLVPAGWLADFAQASSANGGITYSLAGSAALSSGGTYWLVLRDDSAATLWSWTASSEGSGTGFTGDWANSDDAGRTWFTNSTLYPVQMKVVLSGEAVSNVPEPASWALTLAALPWLLRVRRLRHLAPAL